MSQVLSCIFIYINVTGTICVSTIKSKAQRNLTKIVVLATIGYFICWSPSQWYYFLFVIGVPLTDVDPAVYNFTITMVSVHFCINPFIYIFKYDEFRNAAIKLFRLRRRADNQQSIFTLPTRQDESVRSIRK